MNAHRTPLNIFVASWEVYCISPKSRNRIVKTSSNQKSTLISDTGMNSLNNLKACIQTLHLFPSVLFIAATHPINTPFTCHCPHVCLPRPGHRQSRRDPENGLTHTNTHTHTHTHTHMQHAVRKWPLTWLTSWICLTCWLGCFLGIHSSSAGKPAGSSCLWPWVKEKINEGERRKWFVDTEGGERRKKWKEGWRGGKKKETWEERVLSPSPKSPQLKQSKARRSQFFSTVNPIHMKTHKSQKIWK